MFPGKNIPEKISLENCPLRKNPRGKSPPRKKLPQYKYLWNKISPETSSEQIIPLVKNPPILNIFHSVFEVFCVTLDFLLCDIENISIF